VNKLAEITREELHGQVDDAVHALGRARLQTTQSLAFQRGFAGVRRRSLTRAAALVAAAVAVVGLLVWWPRSALTFATEGGDVASTGEGGVRITTGAEASVTRFSDGSLVRFDAWSAGRLEGVRESGARVVLTSGELHLAIAHRSGTAWSVEAGPYVVRVTGTEFDVTWQPATSTFVVSMQQGSVLVEGPLTPKGVTLSGGQHLVIGADGLMRMGEGALPSLGEPASTSSVIATPPAASVAGTTGNDAGSATSSASAMAIASSAARVDAKPSWKSLVADGKYKQVVSEARSRGLESVAETASVEELSALADAARYGKDGAAARAALEAQRKRFGSTQAGRNATFLLGRLAEDGDSNTTRAIALYDEYLQSGGSFAAEALGRKMLAVRKTKGGAGALSVARLYLEKHPTGTYAAAARAIVEAP